MNKKTCSKKGIKIINLIIFIIFIIINYSGTIYELIFWGLGPIPIKK